VADLICHNPDYPEHKHKILTKIEYGKLEIIIIPFSFVQLVSLAVRGILQRFGGQSYNLFPAEYLPVYHR
jgi:hypothetical protein